MLLSPRYKRYCPYLRESVTKSLAHVHSLHSLHYSHMSLWSRELQGSMHSLQQCLAGTTTVIASTSLPLLTGQFYTTISIVLVSVYIIHCNLSDYCSFVCIFCCRVHNIIIKITERYSIRSVWFCSFVRLWFCRELLCPPGGWQ